MNLATYRVETTRTLPDLGSLVTNSLHMTAGIMTELIEIIHIESYLKNFDKRMTDECGDILWYISNYANLHNIELEFKPVPSGRSHIQSAGKLLDMDKKALAYNKPYDIAVQAETLNFLTNDILYMVSSYYLDIEIVLEKNIEKLRVRFPEKFSGDQAINKDESKESDVF